MRRLLCRWPYEPWDCTVCGDRQERPPAGMTLACGRCLDRGMRGEPFIPLTVRMVEPKSEPDRRPVVAVSMRDRTVIVEGGEVFTLGELAERIAERPHGGGSVGDRGYGEHEQLPAAIVATDASVDLLAYLDRRPVLANHPLWQFQIALRAPGAWRPEARAPSRFEFVVPKPARFGFASRRRGHRRATGRARWYQLIDINLFCELPGGVGEPDARELLAFGVELRDWSNREGLPVLAGASAYGSRLLRDARFGGGWRRKVPAATNAQVRKLLPGNHYQLMVAAGRSLSEVHKFDQARAHHHAALTTRFPHPDLLWAEGQFREPLPTGRGMVKHRGSIVVGGERWRELIGQPGMFIVAVSVPERVAIDSLQIPALRKPGQHWRALTSVEIEHVRNQRPSGVRLLDIWCAWASPEEDDRLREYSWWAQRQLQQPDVPHWLKPTLLAAYGMLAARARVFRNAWRWCANPAGAVGWHTRHGHLIAYERSSEKAREPRACYVLARALIESKVRLESLTFAQQLRMQGMNPVAVYADAVFATGIPPARLPIPWRYEGAIHELTFDSPARYRSREETRLPGTPRRREQLADPMAGRTHPQSQEVP